MPLPHYRVLIDHHTYDLERGSARVAVNAALAQHDAYAKSRRKSGHLTPPPVNEVARKGRLHITVAKIAPGGDAPAVAPRARRVKRGVLR